MQIYEVKNDTAEILYAPSSNSLFLSDFLYIEDDKYTTISQVTNISTTENSDLNQATVQFLLSVDKTNRLTKYNGHTPQKNSEVGFLDAKEIINLFAPQYNELIWGNYAREENLQIKTDLKFLSAGSAIVCDKNEQSTFIVNKIVKSLKKNNSRFLILDFDGKYKNVKANDNVVFGQDYRIPLNSKALDYIFENDLNDCPIETKVVIQNILLEIQNYAEAAGFIPFEMFINIIMQECKSCNSAGLMIFANKLLKYKQKKIFADNKNQFALVNNCGSSLKIDISQVDESFYPLIFSSIITDIQKKFYVISDIDEETTTMSILKYIYEKQNVRLIPIIKHDNKFLNKIKSQIRNIVVFAPVAKQTSEEPYGRFLEKLSNDEFILWGENTLFIPIIVSLPELLNSFKDGSDNYSTADDISEEDLNDLDRINLMAAKEIVKAEKITEEDLDFISAAPKKQVTAAAEKETIPEKAVIKEAEKNDYQIIEEEDNQEETAQQEENRPQIIEENTEEYTDQTEEEQYVEPEEVYENTTENVPIREEHTASVQEQRVNIPEQEIHQVQKPKKPMPNPDNIPVYEPKEPEEEKSAVTLQEGDRVSHAKYGNGVVEKIIKYGKKTLCSILFEQTGRRLLDPNITIIEKL